VAASSQDQSDPSSEKKGYQVPFVKISAENCAQDLLERFSVEAAAQNSCVGLSAQGVHRLFARFRHKISTGGLLARSLPKISIRALSAQIS
jgi:hypothetical protein